MPTIRTRTSLEACWHQGEGQRDRGDNDGAFHGVVSSSGCLAWWALLHVREQEIISLIASGTVYTSYFDAQDAESPQHHGGAS
jgi:hypothetical protein